MTCVLLVCSFGNHMHVNSHKAHVHINGGNVNDVKLCTVLSQTERVYWYLKQHDMLLYSWRFSRYSAPIHWLVHGHMTSNNETVYRQMPWAGNIAKTMTSNGKQFTITREMLTAVACHLSIKWLFVFHQFDPFVLLYNKSLNDWSAGEQWMLFPSNLNVWDSQETKFTVPLRTSHFKSVNYHWQWATMLSSKISLMVWYILLFPGNFSSHFHWISMLTQCKIDCICSFHRWWGQFSL